MRKLLNTLYITDELCYLSKDGENIVIKKDDKEIKRLPIHILEGIICFNYNGVSPGTMRLCNENNISITFLTPTGRLCGRFTGKTNGNVYLRRTQYRYADNEDISLELAKQFIAGKMINSRKVLKRVIRDHGEKVDVNKINSVCEDLLSKIKSIETIQNKDTLRGIEGDGARKYFSCFDEMILQQKEDFYFNGRNKRPPMDNVNALLSYLYSILTYEIQSALESVGLDSYVGFFHTDRPGRASLALDVIEELRSYMVDRFVITMINKKQVAKGNFIKKENGSVIMDDDGRKIILTAWQDRKREEITHPFLKEKIMIGLIPYAQAQLLARYIRGDLDEYPPFLI
jgi:CRISPR-associated protein Cas1